MPSAAIDGGLAEFQNLLIGSWSNIALPGAPNAEGSTGNPLAYDVMPLPQAQPQGDQNVGYILKNSTVWENITFNGNDALPPPTTAPNRGSNTLQLPTAIYYQQQVFFGDGPGKGTIVHTENGTWINLATGPKLVGPYAMPTLDNPNQQPPFRTVAKQMSVPHGNSVLALGSSDGPNAGAPAIPDISAFPTDTSVNLAPYKETLNDSDNYQNPNPVWTMNPNVPLQTAVGLLAPNSYIHWKVTTEKLQDGTQGQLSNIPFEQAAARVVDYSADYWLMSTDAGSSFNYLAYSQVILLSLNISGRNIVFPHVTTNVLTKNETVSSIPQQTAV